MSDDSIQCVKKVGLFSKLVNRHSKKPTEMVMKHGEKDQTSQNLISKLNLKM